MFNRYRFLDELKETIQSEYQNINDIDSFIHGIIDNECICYSDCFDICKELNFTHFDHEIFGECKDICQAAFCALYDLIHEESDIYNYFESLTEEA